MVIFKILFQIILYIQLTVSLGISPREPVPHAEVLDEILSEHFKNNTDPNTVSVFDYLFGNNLTEIENVQISEHLDLCVLSPENLKKVVDEAKRKYLLAMQAEKELPKSPSRRKNYLYFIHKPWTVRALNWMKQSIYGTRRRLEVTRPYRKKYHQDISYNIGILSGVLKEMLIKINGVHSALMKMKFLMYFMWSVFAYQRILAFHVDMEYVIRRMFEFQKKWNVLIGRKEKGEEDEEYGNGESGNQTGIMPEMGGVDDIWAALDNLPDEMKPGFEGSSRPPGDLRPPGGISHAGGPGSPGDQGPPAGPESRGDQGPPWGPGPRGDQGPPGEPGPRGDQGPPGETGPQWGPGPRGDSGPQWGPGPNGGPGPWGEPGPHW